MVVLVESCMYANRVYKDDAGMYNIEFSMLGGHTVALRYENEIDARIMYSNLEGKVLEALNSLQEALLSFNSDG